MHIDSTNHAVWNSGTEEWKMPSITPKVTKSKIEEIGPKIIIKR